MRKLEKNSRLVVASHNAGKVREIGALLAPYAVSTFSAADHALEEPEETGVSFIENAEIKALAAAKATGLPALADDSGLVVPALGGMPGIRSARWAGPDKDFQLAMERVHNELAAHTDRSAYFICALVLAWPDGHWEHFEGRIDGAICWPPRGNKGFGYDPIFIPEGHTATFAQMDPKAKHAMSHRARAFEKMVKACFDG